MMQGLFRNPLVDPGLIGVSAGAGFGAVAAIVLGRHLPMSIQALAGFYLVPFAAFVGGWLSIILLYEIATRGGRASVATLLLAGIALGAPSSRSWKCPSVSSPLSCADHSSCGTRGETELR